MKKMLFAVVLLFLIFISFFLISVYVRISRQNELHYLIEQSNLRGESNISLSIMGQLQMMEERLHQMEEPIRFYETEARLQVMASMMSLASSAVHKEAKISFLDGLVRALFGKKSFSLSIPDHQMEILEQAYYFERIRLYDQAVGRYDKLIDMGVEKSMVDAVLLHKAYCLMEIADYQSADIICRKLNRKSDQKEIRTTARIMIEFISNLNRVIEETKSGSLPLLEEGIHYYFTLQYQKTIDLFTPVLLSRVDISSSDVQKMQFFLARSYEALGQAGQALREYKRLIIIEPDGAWALESARRSVMMDSFYDVEVEGIDEILVTLNTIDDPLLKSLEYKSLYRKNDLERPDKEEIAQEQSLAPELYIHSVPSGALIFINGQNIGYTPLLTTELPQGELHIKAVLSHELRNITRVVKKGDIYKLDLDMNPTRASLQVNTDIEITRFVLNGKVMAVGKDYFWDYLPEGDGVLNISGSFDDGTPYFYEQRIYLKKGVLPLSLP